jgi:uracil DNA glycosylase
MHGAHTMQKMNTVVAVYGTHPQAEEALRAFQNTGFDMKKLSIVGKDYHTEEHVIGFYNAGDRMRFTVDDVTNAKRILERTGALSVDEHRVAGAV